MIPPQRPVIRHAASARGTARGSRGSVYDTIVSSPTRGPVVQPAPLVRRWQKAHPLASRFQGLKAHGEREVSSAADRIERLAGGQAISKPGRRIMKKSQRCSAVWTKVLFSVQYRPPRRMGACEIQAAHLHDAFSETGAVPRRQGGGIGGDANCPSVAACPTFRQQSR
jgi:hypothetical protein